MKQQTAPVWVAMVAIGLFPAMLFAQTHQARQNVSADPGGWTKAKWGMKESQIKATFPQASQIEGCRWGG
jgi:hypothetical protein